MTDSLLHFPIYIGDALKKFIENPTLEERGAWISIVVAMVHNDGELLTEDELYRYALIFNEQDKQSLSKALAKLKQAGVVEEIKSLINKQKGLRKTRQEAGRKGGLKSKKNKQSLSNSESESESELNTELELESFNLFRSNYPLQGRGFGSVKKAKEKLTVALKKDSIETITQGARNYGAYIRCTGQSNQDAFRWLENERWNDDYTIAVAAQQSKDHGLNEAAVRGMLRAENPDF